MFHNKNLIKVKSLLTKNNYPINFIENNVKRCMSKIKYCSLDNNNNNKNNKPINIYKQTIKVHIPYIIEEIFLKLSQIFQKYNFSSIPKVCKNLNPIVKLGNDTLDKWNQINVVYKFAWKNCPAPYIGETKRSLKTRINEHKNKKSTESVVCQHQVNYNHEFNWEESKIIDQESNYKKRLTSEMIHIKSNHNGINKKEDIYTLNKIYFPIFKLINSWLTFIFKFLR